jgi:arylsulfatase A-like enzyme
MTDHTRRDFIKTGLAASAAVGLHAFPNSAEAIGEVEKRPNIVIFYTDDQRWDSLGYMGNPIIQTPCLNRLAKEGVAFSNSFCTTSICCTSRATLLTGMHCERHGIDAFNQPLTKELWAQTFPMLLREAGYRMGFVGKWGLGGSMPEEDYDFWAGFAGQGTYFEEVDGQKVHRTTLMERDAFRFLDGCDSERPFCLQIGFKAPHCLDGDPRPFHPNPVFDDLYRNVRIPVPKTATQECFERLPEFLQTSEGRKRWEIRFSNPDLYQNTVKDYYRLITGVDHVVGDVMVRLAEKGFEKNTIVLFTSDNGFFLGEHGLAGKWFMHEESIRVPLLVHDPRLSVNLRGRTIPEMALNIDVAPTLLDLAGVRIPATVQGDSLLPLLQGETVEWRRSWFYSHPFVHERIPRSEGVRTESWKYVRYIDADPLYEELYDLDSDRYEERNLALEPAHAEKLKEMRTRWEHLRKAAR